MVLAIKYFVLMASIFPMVMCIHSESLAAAVHLDNPQAMKAKFHSVKSKHIARTNEAQVKLLKQDAENQHAILSKKQSSDFVSANSMSPHLSMHSTRGQEAGRGRHIKVQPTAYGKQVLPPDEATPFFETYVLRYAFPTIAIICSCLACVLLRTMRMYQKERWKGTSYFHGARRSAESLLPGLK
mmetsp:Transcript_50773/g.106098  ORF Transcript_50773/g.106098 Transcript_50773/m.106098 type:complete len:184 (-) Transcript_50773:344-895(-)